MLQSLRHGVGDRAGAEARSEAREEGRSELCQSRPEAQPQRSHSHLGAVALDRARWVRLQKSLAWAQSSSITLVDIFVGSQRAGEVRTVG